MAPGIEMHIYLQNAVIVMHEFEFDSIFSLKVAL